LKCSDSYQKELPSSFQKGSRKVGTGRYQSEPKTHKIIIGIDERDHTNWNN